MEEAGETERRAAPTRRAKQTGPAPVMQRHAVGGVRSHSQPFTLHS